MICSKELKYQFNRDRLFRQSLRKIDLTQLVFHLDLLGYYGAYFDPLSSVLLEPRTEGNNFFTTQIPDPELEQLGIVANPVPTGLCISVTPHDNYNRTNLVV